ncbi:MAG: ROK family protein [Actinobacteria bacterium]|nr:ROK family protein [Actinomycetota bacterium]
MSVIGVDVGGTKIAAVRLDPALGPTDPVVIPTPDGGMAIVKAIAGLVGDLAAGSPDVVRAVGVGLPATIDAVTGRVAHSVHTGMDDFDAAGALEAAVGLPVFLDNDANLAALAEHRLGAGRGRANVVLLTLGTGIGGGLIIEGRVFRGGRGQGAELGHISVDGNGPPCQGGCPNRGCIETMCSGTALAREFCAFAADNTDTALGQLHAAGHLDSRSGLALAQQGNPEALAIVTMAGEWLGVAVTSLANTFDPDIILIGGGLSAAGELLLGPARAVYQQRALPPTRRAPLQVAALGPDAGMVGAGVMAHEGVGG